MQYMYTDSMFGCVLGYEVNVWTTTLHIQPNRKSLTIAKSQKPNCSPSLKSPYCTGHTVTYTHTSSAQTRLTAYCITNLPSMELFHRTIHATMSYNLSPSIFSKTLQNYIYVKSCTLISHVYQLTLIAWGSAAQVSLRILCRLSIDTMSTVHLVMQYRRQESC